MERVFEFLAITSAALFAGGALYVTIAEHPGRMEAGVSAALAEFRPSYVRAAPWQALLAIIGLVCGAVVAIQSSDWVWAIGAALTGSSIPLTLIVIMPVNDRLVDPNISDPEAERHLRRWGRLHFLRSLLGSAGLVVFVMRSIS